MVDIGVHVSSHLKEELTLAVGKRLRVVSTICYLKNTKTTKELKGTIAVLTILSMLLRMWPLVTYSNYFEIVSTVTFLHSPTGLIPGIFLFKTVILYHYIFIHINNDYTKYNICSACWFLDIVISTCLSLILFFGTTSLLKIP